MVVVVVAVMMAIRRRVGVGGVYMVSAFLVPLFVGQVLHYSFLVCFLSVLCLYPSSPSRLFCRSSSLVQSRPAVRELARRV